MFLFIGPYCVPKRLVFYLSRWHGRPSISICSSGSLRRWYRHMYERRTHRMTTKLGSIQTATLEISYEDSGPETGAPVFLMHGWPYGPRVYDRVVPLLIDAGC